eukprot:gene10021-6998_t
MRGLLHSNEGGGGKRNPRQASTSLIRLTHVPPPPRLLLPVPSLLDSSSFLLVYEEVRKYPSTFLIDQFGSLKRIPAETETKKMWGRQTAPTSASLSPSTKRKGNGRRGKEDDLLRDVVAP